MKSRLLLGGLLLAAVFSAFANEAAQRENLFTLPLTAFKTSDENASQKLYVKPGVDLKQYSAVILEPLYFMRQEADGNWELLQSTEENKIAHYYQERMTEELKKVGIPVVDQPGEGVATIRAAVTGMALGRLGLKPLDVLPIKAVANLTRMAVGKEKYLVKIGSMAQMEDSESGDLLAGSVNLRKTQETTYKDSGMTKEVVDRLIDGWCKENAKLLARAMTTSKTVTH